MGVETCTECSFPYLYTGKKEKESLGHTLLNAYPRALIIRHLGFFEPAKRPDDREDYCPGCSFLPQCKQVLVLHLNGLKRSRQSRLGVKNVKVSAH